MWGHVGYGLVAVLWTLVLPAYLVSSLVLRDLDSFVGRLGLSLLLVVILLPVSTVAFAFAIGHTIDDLMILMAAGFWNILGTGVQMVRYRQRLRRR